MGIGYTCNAVPDYAERALRNHKIIQEAARRLNMEPVTPVDQIRKTIAHYEGEAKWARENAEAALARAAEEEKAAAAHEETAQEWRRILGILDENATKTRIVKVKFEVDSAQFMAEAQRAAEALRNAGETLPYARGGIHSGPAPLANIAEAEQPWEAYLSGRRKPCTCGPNDHCSDCPTPGR